MVQLTDEQKVTLHAAPKTAKGNDAPVDGVPTWSTSDDTLVTLAPSADGFSCDAITVGPLGGCTITCTADADLGPDVAAVLGTIDITVVAAPAASVAVTADAPVIK